MADPWSDINDPGFFFKPQKAQPAPQEQQADTASNKKNDVEVRLSGPQWKEGPDGYVFNKKAKVSVAVEYLKQTSRKRVGFEVFVETDGKREDLRQKVDGFENNGRAEAEITLYYGDSYTQKLNDDPSATCKYIFKATHPTGEKPVESPPLEMPQEVSPPLKKGKLISCKFSVKTAPCGDNVDITAESDGVANGDMVQLGVEQLSDAKSVLAINSPISGNKCSAVWTSKKTNSSWNGAEVGEVASWGSMKIKGADNFTFKSYGPYAQSTKTANCVSGIFGWTGKYDIEVTDREILVTVKIKLQNRTGPKPAPATALPAIGPSVSAADKTAMKADIESKLSGKWLMHRQLCKRGAACDCNAANRCCKIPVKVIVDFVESGEHHIVDLFQGNARANATNWTRVKTRDNSWAHETGHLLGWYDEYVGGAVGTAPRWKAPDPTAVMNVGLDVPQEYYWDFRDFINSQSGEAWNIQ